MNLVVISSENGVNDESSIINQLFHSGLKCLHIRKPNDEISQVRKLIARIDSKYYSYISLHQHFKLAEEFDIKGLHYPEFERNKKNEQNWENLIQQGYKLSTSIHQFATLNLVQSFNYVFYGPVFDSISKLGYQSNVNEKFKLIKTTVYPKVIAIGGISISNLNQVKEMNFDGAAVLGTIWEKPENALCQFEQLLKCTKN